VIPRRRVLASILVAGRFVAAGAVLARLARAARRVAPVAPVGVVTDHPPPSDVETASCKQIDVVVPARDEALRIAPLLAGVVGAPGVREVIVVDDASTDDTAEVARRAGARVVTGSAIPLGWTGKAWALQQGVLAATTEWVVMLDSDTRPDPRLPASIVARAAAEDLDVLSVAGRFECPTLGLRWLHPAMLTTLVYRFGPPGWAVPRRANRLLANGQCMAVRRAAFVAGGGMAPAAGHIVEDVAIARHIAGAGGRVAFLDASSLLSVRMHETLADAWSSWGRSLALPGVDSRWRQVLHVAELTIAMVLPLPRLAIGRGDVLDVVLVLTRWGTLVGTVEAYEQHGLAYWCSPLADGVAVAALVRGMVTRRRTWRGRVYAGARPGSPARTAPR
jgi:dolichol-phosphate mannosyltransferase